MSGRDELASEVLEAATAMVRRSFGQGIERVEAHRTGWAPQLWKNAVESGWFDLQIPEDEGGLGLEPGSLGGFFTLLGLDLVPGAFLEHMALLPLLRPHATQSLLTQLEAARTGETLVTIADPDAAADQPGEATLADGILSGRVPMVRHAERADALVVVCGRDTETSVVLVHANEPGVSLEPRRAFDATFSVADVLLTDVRVRDDHIFTANLGTSLESTVVRMRAVARFLVAAELAGLARHLLDASVDYSLQREQFGRQIGSFQAVQQMLGDMAHDVVALEAYVADVMPEPGSADMSILKGFAAKTARRVGEGALQVHGGIAFTEEFDLHRWFLRVLSLQGLYGDDAATFLRVGRALLARS